MGDIKNWYISNFDIFESKLNGGNGAVVSDIRRAAIARFADLGFPTPRNEKWKYTNVAPILEHKFKPFGDAVELSREKLESFLYPRLTGNVLVFVNGRFAKALSQLEPESSGVIVDNLAHARERHDALIDRYYTRLADYEHDTFTALNTAFAHDGVFIHVPANTVVPEPIHILNLSVPHDTLFLSHPRSLIVVGRNSHVQILETYHALAEGIYFNNVVTEIVVEDNATVEHTKIQNESRKSYHIATTQVHQLKNSVYTSNSVDLGGALVRNNLNTVLDAENCEANLYGFFMGSGNQHIDNQTLIDHARPRCNSNELYKGILDDRATGVFNGKIMVRRDAQKTNAYQSSKCLLLTNEARANNKPQLEIFADDVKCSHGSTVGQLDEEALFYLRSRGIDETRANSMLRYAFAADAIEKIKIVPVRAQLDKVIFKRLGKIE